MYRTQSELADDMHYFSMGRGSCVKGIIFYHLERTPYDLSLGDRFANLSVMARFAHLETRERKLITREATTLSLLLLYAT